jgi:tRNA A37 threonylcarbamoyladenosine synthetase subunit TsaC/SUA5/YrdC
VPEIQERLGDGVGVYLDGGAASADRGSTIVDCTGPEVRIIREGLISALQVRAAANRV